MIYVYMYEYVIIILLYGQRRRQTLKKYKWKLCGGISYIWWSDPIWISNLTCNIKQYTHWIWTCVNLDRCILSALRECSLVFASVSVYVHKKVFCWRILFLHSNGRTMFDIEFFRANKPLLTQVLLTIQHGIMCALAGVTKNFDPIELWLPGHISLSKSYLQ